MKVDSREREYDARMPSEPVPLEVALASRQQRFYADAGQEAFSGTVPFRLSTSRATARLVVHAAQAFAQRRGKRHVRLVDVGAGTGRLGYHARLQAPDVRLVLTDASAAMCEALRAHPQLAGATVVHAAATDFGAALACADDEALVVVGTYLLDTLPHALMEAPMGRRAFVDDSGRFTFRSAPLDAFTRAYVARLGHGRAFLPTGAFDFVRALEAQLDGPALLVLGDKVASTTSAAREGERPRLVAHGAGASVLVNLDALRGWLGWRGWTQARGGSDDFVVGATVLRGRCRLDGLFGELPHPLDVQARVTALRNAHEVLPQTRAREATALRRDDGVRDGEVPRLRRSDTSTPGTGDGARGAGALGRKAVAPRRDELVPSLLALEPDGDVLLELSDALVDVASRGVDEALRQRLAEWLLEAARTTFVLPADDVAFHAGRVLQALGFAGAAVACFSESLARHGDADVTRLFRATALLALEARARALEDVDAVLGRSPAHEQALALRAAASR